jgi:hypothetical protein
MLSTRSIASTLAARGSQLWLIHSATRFGHAVNAA